MEGGLYPCWAHGMITRFRSPDCGHFRLPPSSHGFSEPTRMKVLMSARRMPRPEDVSRDHIDSTIIGFLRGEKDADWTGVSLLTLHPREEIRIVLRENAERYRSLNDQRFRDLVALLRSQAVTGARGRKRCGGPLLSTRPAGSWSRPPPRNLKSGSRRRSKPRRRVSTEAFSLSTPLDFSDRVLSRPTSRGRNCRRGK